MQLVHVRSMAGRGDQPHQFELQCTGIAVGPQGRIYVTGDRELKIFSPDGNLVGRHTLSGVVWSICADADSLWIGLPGAVERLDAQGETVERIADAPHMGLVTGIAAVGHQMMLADAANKMLRLYQKGRWQRDVGLDVNTRGFMLPNGVLTVAYDQQSKRFVVAHPQKHRVERYELDGSSAGHFGKFGNEQLADFGGCCNPNTIAVTPAGRICVSEKAPPRVKVYTHDGQFLGATPEGSFAAEAKNLPMAADAQERIYVIDTARLTVETFEMREED